MESAEVQFKNDDYQFPFYITSLGLIRRCSIYYCKTILHLLLSRIVKISFNKKRRAIEKNSHEHHAYESVGHKSLF